MLKCLVCQNEMCNVQPDVVPGTIFHSYGNFGSTVLDLERTASYIVICNDCLESRLDCLYKVDHIYQEKEIIR